MSETTEYTCALWYWTYGSPRFELCETEQEAASLAHAIEDADTGSVAGVQFSDGRLIEKNRWEEYDAESRRRMAEFERHSAAMKKAPPLTTKVIRVPFDGLTQDLRVPVDRPSWLGLHDPS